MNAALISEMVKSSILKEITTKEVMPEVITAVTPTVRIVELPKTAPDAAKHAMVTLNTLNPVSTARLDVVASLGRCSSSRHFFSESTRGFSYCILLERGMSS